MIDRYGKKWPSHYSDATIELRCYRDNLRRSKPQEAAKHFSGAAQLLIPDKVYRWNYWTDDIINAWCSEDFITNWGAGGTGKSTTWAMVLLVDWVADPINTVCKIFTTDQLKQRLRLMGEIIRIHDAVGNLPGEVQADMLIYKSPTGKRKKNAGIWALTVTNRAGRVQKVSNFGIHNRWNRMFIDEMQGTPRAAFDSIDNFLMGGYELKFVGIGNPEEPGDMLCQYSVPKDGYHGMHPDTMKANVWDTYVNNERLGKCVWFDGLKSPRIVEPNGERRYPFLIGRKGIDMLRKLRGEESEEFYTQVRGFIKPDAMRTDTCLDIRVVDTVNARARVPFANYSAPLIGIDPSFSATGDEAIAHLARGGKAPGGKHVLQFVQPSIKLQVVPRSDVPVSHQLAKQIKRIADDNNVDRRGIACDTSGPTGGPADVLRADHGFYVERVSFGSMASQEAWNPADKRKARDIYGNKATELYFMASKMIEYGHVKGLPPKVIDQMIDRRVMRRMGRWVLEPKDDYKGRHRKESPNDADAFAVLCWLFFRRFKVRLGAGEVIHAGLSFANPDHEWMEEPLVPSYSSEEFMTHRY